MRTKIQPGTYCCGFLSRDGRDETLCRCPICWHEWFIDTESHLDVKMQMITRLECLCCCQSSEYTSAESKEKGPPAIATELPYVSRKRKEPNPTVSGGLFSGFDSSSERPRD